MPILYALVVVGAVAFVAALAVLTGVGSRRRGDVWPIVILSGLMFPATRMVWYFLDEEHLRRDHRRVPAADTHGG